MCPSPASILILCLGNDILSDDGFGFAVADRLEERGELPPGVELIKAALAGFNLLDYFAERSQVLIVDTIQTGKASPGTLHHFAWSEFAPSYNLTTSHQISLPTAVTLGRELGMNMPDQIEVLAVEARDLVTLSENLTPSVALAVNGAVDWILNWIDLSLAE